MFNLNSIGERKSNKKTEGYLTLIRIIMFSEQNAII